MPNTYSSKWKLDFAKHKLLKENPVWEGFPASDPGHSPERDIIGLNQRHQASQEQDTRWTGYMPCSALPSELEKQALSPDWECSGLAEIFPQLLSLEMWPHNRQYSEAKVTYVQQQLSCSQSSTPHRSLLNHADLVRLGAGWKLRFHPVPAAQRLLYGKKSTIFSRTENLPWKQNTLPPQEASLDSQAPPEQTEAHQPDLKSIVCEGRTVYNILCVGEQGK